MLSILEKKTTRNKRNEGTRNISQNSSGHLVAPPIQKKSDQNV